MFGLFISERGLSIGKADLESPSEFAQSPEGGPIRFRLAATFPVALNDELETVGVYEEIVLTAWDRAIRPEAKESEHA